MNTFDAPSRSNCTVWRQETNTPLQALVLLNDPQFLEASRVIGEKALRRTKSLKDQIIYMFRLLTARVPTEMELEILVNLYNEQASIFERNPVARRAWTSGGESKADPSLDMASLAASTVVANTIMNSDAYITKR